MTSGLPTLVHHPAALLRRRLTDKLPPQPPPPIPAPPDPGVRGVQSARASGGPAGRRMQRLPGRIRAPTRPASLLPAPEIHARANEIRAAMSLKREEGTLV